MRETTKAVLRRAIEDDTGIFPWRSIFKGNMLDIGSGNDPLHWALPFDLPDGGGDDLRDFFGSGPQFDLIHGSQVCEHFKNPVLALESWIEKLNPGGHIVASVPSWELYEKERWPSRFNFGHVSTWSMVSNKSPAPIHCKMPEWLAQFPVKVLRCAQVDANFNHSLGPDVDQTYNFSDRVEAFIEFVLKKP